MDFARIRRFLGLTQRDVSVATGILLSRISGAERDLIQLTRSEREVLITFLRTRLRVVLGGSEAEAPGDVLGLIEGHDDS